jgi:GAF domain-containing protein
MSAPLRPVGPESFAQLALRLSKADAHDPRIESLFENLIKAQQEMLEPVLGGAGLGDVLARAALVLDRVLAPARCSISLFEGPARRLRDHAAPHLGPELKPASEPSPGHVPGPLEAALVQGARVVASDFQIEPRWPIYAGKALVRGLRACWAEPVDCGDGLTAVVALFQAEPAAPNAHDERLLKAVAAVIAFAIKASQRGPARGIYAQRSGRAH